MNTQKTPTTSEDEARRTLRDMATREGVLRSNRAPILRSPTDEGLAYTPRCFE